MRDAWNEITSFDKPIYHTTIGDTINHSINISTETAAGEQERPAAGQVTVQFQYDFKNVILYALSLGYSTSDNKNLKFLYENHEDFCVVPSFGVIPAFANLYEKFTTMKLPHNIQLGTNNLLHGEHYLELYKPLSTSGTLSIQSNLVDVLDKGIGATLIINGI